MSRVISTICLTLGKQIPMMGEIPRFRGTLMIRPLSLLMLLVTIPAMAQTPAPMTNVQVEADGEIGVSVLVRPRTTYGAITVYRPAYQLVPYQYSGSTIVERRYPTPLRDAIFGRYRGYHFYKPMR